MKLGRITAGIPGNIPARVFNGIPISIPEQMVDFSLVDFLKESLEGFLKNKYWKNAGKF